MNHRTGKKILLADNNPEYRHSVIVFLELEGYVVDEADTVEVAQNKLEHDEFDLLLVELRMRDDSDANDASGLEIAKFASEVEVPCILITAFPTVDIARIALRSDARKTPLIRDLIIKSSGPDPLLDAIRLVLAEEDAKSAMKGLIVDLEKGIVLRNGEIIDLTKNQYVLLEALYRKNGNVSTSAELIKVIYGEEIKENIARSDPRILNLVDQLKKRIERKGSRHALLEALPGSGYKLNTRFIHRNVVSPLPDKLEDTAKMDVNPGAQEESAGVFISYARPDGNVVQPIYELLVDKNHQPWMDLYSIKAGENWFRAITRAIDECDIFLAILSNNSVSRRGIIQKELKKALDKWEEMLPDDIYIIPVRIDDCPIPEFLRHIQVLDWRDGIGASKLLEAIEAGMARRKLM